eukprot:NODE_379_length_8451_cov_0.593630.p3 type:complete len:372 gc:universal NODE_379_length_8451_cov_0.593630:1979-864(-)
MIDCRTILCKAGNGGKGAISFNRGAFIPKGKPNGGNGGNGGNIYFKANPSLPHLGALKSTYTANNGGIGRNMYRHGKNAIDLFVDVPVGTSIKLYHRSQQSPFSQENTHNEIYLKTLEIDTLSDLKLIAKGGAKGLGNPHYSSKNSSPRISGKGEPGQLIKAYLELKCMADIGLVGLPNSGKSSLVRKLSNCNSKVGDYAFTTKSPSIGICLSRDYFLKKYSEKIPDQNLLKIADIPGIIDGASEDKGLGHKFLKHIEKCKLLLIVLDSHPELSTNLRFENSRLLDTYNQLLNELFKFNPKLASLPKIVVLNKMDLLSESDHSSSRVVTFMKNVDADSFLCSSRTGENIFGNKGLGIKILDACLNPNKTSD